MQTNKHGIPIAQPNRKSIKRQLRQEVNRTLDCREYVEFGGYEKDVEITIVVPNFHPIVQAVQEDGWILRKYSKGEIA